ncbi:hypothetical protein FGO68_gene2233 [Halteria grandinella]|uniref:FCP1 homology domain-containing protein n=1 Tax=Halteria grandinella TaxID=5974 RepID=A0A8J8P761_HALGN|nr:hypothetical protein FGO68_gene2233 [Halteria grandinella]
MMMSSKALGLKRKEQTQNIELLVMNNSSGSEDNNSGGGGIGGIGDYQDDELVIAFNSNYGVADQNSNGPGSHGAVGSGANSPSNYVALQYKTSIIEVPDESEITLLNFVAMDIKEFKEEIGVMPIMANSAALPQNVGLKQDVESSKNRVLINHKESCNLVEDEDPNKIIKSPQNGQSTVNDLLKLYKPQMPQLTGHNNIKKNPLLKSKGRIRDDWGSLNVDLGDFPHRSMIGGEFRMPYSNLINDGDYQDKAKTKSILDNINYSSFNSGQQPMCGPMIGGNNPKRGLFINRAHNWHTPERQGRERSDSNDTSNVGQHQQSQNRSLPPLEKGNRGLQQSSISLVGVSFEKNQAGVSSVMVASPQAKKHHPRTIYKDSRQQFLNGFIESGRESIQIENIMNDPNPLSASQVTPSSAQQYRSRHLGQKNNKDSTNYIQHPGSSKSLLTRGQQSGPGVIQQFRAKTPQLRQRKVNGQQPFLLNSNLSGGNAAVILDTSLQQQHSIIMEQNTPNQESAYYRPVSKISNFLIQLYNKIVQTGDNSSNNLDRDLAQIQEGGSEISGSGSGGRNTGGRRKGQQQQSRCGSEEVRKTNRNESPHMQIIKGGQLAPNTHNVLQYHPNNGSVAASPPKKSAFKHSENIMLSNYSLTGAGAVNNGLQIQSNSQYISPPQQAEKLLPRQKQAQKRVRIFTDNSSNSKEHQGLAPLPLSQSKNSPIIGKSREEHTLSKVSRTIQAYSLCSPPRGKHNSGVELSQKVGVPSLGIKLSGVQFKDSVRSPLIGTINNLSATNKNNEVQRSRRPSEQPQLSSRKQYEEEKVPPKSINQNDLDKALDNDGKISRMHNHHHCSSEIGEYSDEFEDSGDSRGSSLGKKSAGGTTGKGKNEVRSASYQRTKYKKWKSETTNLKKRLQDSTIISKKSKLQKVKTQKEMLVAEADQDKEKLAASKSYIYLAKGLSDELSDDNSSKGGLGGINYRSAFFENDKDLEDYHKQLKEALMVQFQKEINIASHFEVKRQYEGWVQNYQQLFIKKSPFKKTLVFDLDETLVRVQKDEPKYPYDTRINVVDQSTQSGYFMYVMMRPYLIRMLTVLRKHYELVLFTAASDQYADIVLQSFEGHQYFDHILSRKQCLHIYQKQVFIKDLSILLGGRVIRDIIIVDNKIESYSSNLENGIPIISYYGEPGDIMLKKLAKYLLRLKDASDVREFILKDFYLQELASMQRSNVSRIFDTTEIKACVLKSRDQQRHRATLPPERSEMILMLGSPMYEDFDRHYRIPGCKSNPAKKLSEEDVLAEQDQSEPGDQFNSGSQQIEMVPKKREVLSSRASVVVQRSELIESLNMNLKDHLKINCADAVVLESNEEDEEDSPAPKLLRKAMKKSIVKITESLEESKSSQLIQENHSFNKRGKEGDSPHSAIRAPSSSQNVRDPVFTMTPVENGPDHQISSALNNDGNLISGGYLDQFGTPIYQSLAQQQQRPNTQQDQQQNLVPLNNGDSGFDQSGAPSVSVGPSGPSGPVESQSLASTKPYLQVTLSAVALEMLAQEELWIEQKLRWQMGCLGSNLSCKTTICCLQTKSKRAASRWALWESAKTSPKF